MKMVWGDIIDEVNPLSAKILKDRCDRFNDLPNVKCTVDTRGAFEAVLVDTAPFGYTSSLLHLCYGEFDCFISGDIPIPKNDPNKTKKVEEYIRQFGGHVHDIHYHKLSDHYHPLFRTTNKKIGLLKFENLIREMYKINKE